MSARDALHVIACVCPAPADASGTTRVLGELDVRAVAKAVRMARAAGPQGRMTAVCCGDAGARLALAECTALGADATVQVEAEEHSDGEVVAERLAPVLRELSGDVVVCGERSQTGMHGTVPYAVADALGAAFVGSVVALDVADGEVRAVQRLERGDRWAWMCPMPVVCSVVREVIEPPYLSVLRLARAAGSEPRTWDEQLQDCGSRLASKGSLEVLSHGPLRIRPKKSKAPTAKMSAADRMKFLRGGKAPGPSGGDDDAPSRVSGSPAEAAEEIIKLLEKRELL